MPKAVASGNTPPAHILVIDDDKAMRDACFQILSRQGYRVELAASAHQGLTLLERSSFDAILLDLVMPDMDGLEALKKIRALDPDVRSHHHHRLRHHPVRGGIHQGRGLPFPLQALCPRRPAQPGEPGPGKTAPGPGKPLSAPGAEDQGRRDTLVYESESMIRIMDMARGWPPRTPPCSSPGNPAPARAWWPARFTS